MSEGWVEHGHLRGGEDELRCQGCGKWLDEMDLSCGLMQFCTDCCLEPGFFHELARDDDAEADR